MTDRVTSPDWSPFDPWETPDTHRDPHGGPALERVTKLCRDARGHDRLRGCGRRFEGWALATGQQVAQVVPETLRRQIVEDGAVWGLCDTCLTKIEAYRPERQTPDPYQPSKPRRVGEY